MTTYTCFTFLGLEKCTRNLFCEESRWDFRTLFLMFSHALDVRAIQEAGDMCCSTYDGYVLTVIV